jgi:hypothetical protein
MQCIVMERRMGGCYIVEWVGPMPGRVGFVFVGKITCTSSPCDSGFTGSIACVWLKHLFRAYVVSSGEVCVEPLDCMWLIVTCGCTVLMAVAGQATWGLWHMCGCCAPVHHLLWCTAFYVRSSGMTCSKSETWLRGVAHGPLRFELVYFSTTLVWIHNAVCHLVLLYWTSILSS